MTAIAAQNSEKNAAPRAKSAGRRTTDKYWSLLPILLLVIWIAAFQDVFGKLLYHSRASDGNFESHVSEAEESYKSNDKFDSHVSEAKDSFKPNDEFDSIVNKKEDLSNSKNIKNDWLCFDDNNCIDGYRFIRNKRNSYEAMNSVNKIWGQNWIFDIIAGNIGFFNENYQRSGTIVIWANVLVCFSLIAYSLASLSTNNMHRRMILVFGMYFGSMATIRFFIFYLHDLDAAILYWLVPELAFEFIATLYTLIFLCKLYKDINQDHDKKTEKTLENYFSVNIGSGIRVIAYILFMALSFILHFKALDMFATVVLHSNLDKIFLYSLVGIICYVSLIIHYFGFMVISCANSLGRKHGRWCPGILDHLRAFLIVSRYHFGTACYHATIIVPKIKAILIMNEEEFKVIPLFSTIERLYMMHWKVHDLSLMMTAVRGYDYSEAVRESLRLSTRDSPKPIKNSNPSFSQFFRCGSILWLAINNLVIIGLWASGVLLEPGTVVQNYHIHLTGMFLTTLLGKLHDLWFDTDWLYTNENRVKALVQTV